MRYLLTFALLLALSFAVSDDTSAEPVVFMTAVRPSTIDNQVEEEVNFEGDCDICNEEQLEYFYWNSSVDFKHFHGSGCPVLEMVLGD